MRSIKHVAAALFIGLVAVMSGAITLAATQGPDTQVAASRAASLAIDVGGSILQSSDGADVVRYTRPLIRVGQDFTLPAKETAYQLLTVFGQVTLEGEVEDDVTVVGGNVRLKSTATVGRSLVVVAGNLTIDPGAAVRGDLVLVGGTFTAPADFAPGGEHVIIRTPNLGDTFGRILPWITHGLLLGRLIVPTETWLWPIIGVIFLVYLAVNTLFDRSVATAADAVVHRPVSAFLLGLLVLILAIPILAILAATVIGLAVVPFVACAMLVGALVGKAGVARAAGRTIVAQSAESRLQSLRSFVIGSILITLAYMVPILGIVTWSLATVLGVGAAAAALRAAIRREHPPRERVVAPLGPAPGSPLPADSAMTPAQATLAAADADEGPGGAAPAPTPTITGLPFPRATFLDRVAAFAVDCVLIGVAVQMLDLSHQGGSFPLLLFVYYVAFWAWKGTTLGGIVVGLRVTRANGAALRPADAIVRALGSILSVAALGIGCLWMLQDADRQMWHDKIAGTVVLKVPRELALA